MKRNFLKIMLILVLLMMITGCNSDMDEKEYSSKVQEQQKEETVTEKKDLEEEDQLLQALKLAGITEYEKRDLSQYKTEDGIPLSEQYASYRFFYESDGYQIEAFISAPLEVLKQDKPGSCLIYNHGGNRNFGALTVRELTTCYYAHQFQTVCVASNYRGCGNSEGTDEFGGGDIQDVIHLIDLCEKLSFIDVDAINMLGVSRGGMMTYETLREDDRIHRAVVVSGVCDSFMMYEKRDDMKTVYKELVGGSPEDMPEEYERRSATYWAEELKAPVLMFHTTGDTRVDVSQADKMAECLEEAGAEFEYVRYEADTHGKLRKEDLEKIMEWFSKN